MNEKYLNAVDVGPHDYWQNITKINQKQEAKGVSKYGQNLEDNITLSTVQRIEHLQEELIDGLKYCEHIKQVARDNLTANDYQRMAMRTAGTYENDYKMLCNAVYGLNGEAGEVIDLLKKHEFQGHQLDKNKLIDEAGDVAWYLALLATALGVSLQDILMHNVDKLKSRYPDGFNKNRSINRKDNLNPLYIETRSKRLQLLVQPSLLDKLKSKAKAEGRSVNDLVHSILEEALRGE